MSLFTTFIVLIFWPYLSTQTMVEKSFCKALYKNDLKSLKFHIDKKLEKLDIDNGTTKSFELFKEWLEDHNCINSVEVIPGMLRSDPPIKVFIASVTYPDSTIEMVDINIRVLSDKLIFNYK